MIEELRSETEKWLNKIKNEIKNIELVDKGKENLFHNINAYISDCEHFLRSGKLIIAFEAIIWAWSWLTILKELGIVREKPNEGNNFKT